MTTIQNGLRFKTMRASAAGVQVTITCATSGATIYYTTDSTNPSTTSTQYSAPFFIFANTTVKAYAVKDGLLDSLVATANIEVTLPTPVLQKTAGATSDVCTVAITNTADFASYTGVHYYYTLDGVDPTEESQELTTPFSISLDHNCTVKVKAFFEGGEASLTGELAVEDLRVQTPEISGQDAE